jgi:hypothetical protein
VIFAANAIASASLYGAADAVGGGRMLLQLNLVFGAVYLPWQVLHLRSLRAEARTSAGRADPAGPVGWMEGLRDSIHERNRRTDAHAWGGLIGLTWTVGYWATLIPMWVHVVVPVVSAR